MISGTQALGSIDKAIRRARAETEAVDQDIAGLTERRLRLQEQEGQACRELALFRIRQAAGGDMISALTAAEEHARVLIKRRAEAADELDVRIREAEAENARLSEIHASRLADVESRRREYAAVEEMVLDRLAATQAYREQAQRAEAAARLARHAEAKTRRSEEDRQKKGRPYEEDPLFMYLWRRGYGTTRYRWGAFARFFDRRIARLIGFDKARANYAMLLEIPRRLREHADRLRQQAESEAQKLEEMESAALCDSEAAGPARRLAATEKAAEELQEQLEAAEERAAALAAQRADLVSGEDAETRKAVSDIANMLQDKDIRELRESARLTPLPDDDHIVERIAAIEADLEDVDEELSSARERQSEQRHRLLELEKIRHEYRRRGCGACGWDFGDSRMLSVLLAQVIGGAMSRDGFWGQMNRRRLPGPFSGDWGGRRRRAGFPGGWGKGVPRASRRPRPPRRGGGFRTTGSF